MAPLPDAGKTMGASVPTFLVLFAICWLCMLGTMATWIGKTPVPGRDTDRMISQAYSGGFALLAWIFLAALLLIATSKEVMPAQMGFVAWLVHPSPARRRWPRSHRSSIRSASGPRSFPP
jgi:hypothetical protein